MDRDRADINKAEDAAADELVDPPIYLAMDRILHRFRCLWGCPLAGMHLLCCHQRFPNNSSHCRRVPNRLERDVAEAVFEGPLRCLVDCHQLRQND